MWIAIVLLGLAPAAWAEGPTESAAPNVPPTLLGLPRGEYQQRRRELMKRVRDAAVKTPPANPFRRGPLPKPLIVLRGADDPDIEGKFRQSNDFAYLTGVTIPSAVLVLDPDQDREVLYVPPRGSAGDPLSAARPGPGPQTAADHGLQRVEPTTSLLGDLFSTIADPLFSARGGARRVVYYPTTSERADGPDARLERLLRQGAPSAEFRDIRPFIAALRKVKSPAELELLRKAIAITGTAQIEVAKRLRPGVHEYELEGAILGAFVAGGAARPGFPSIVGSGPNSTIPHYFANDRRIEDGDLLVVDIGAEYRLYTADITRTFPASGRFTPRQRELYQLVLDAQKAVEAEMKPGKTRLSDMTRFTREFLDKSPLRARDQDGDERSLGAFFIHGLGHYLGMDVHDVGGYGDPVQIGEVFTIEPGIYIKSEDIGIRIEDDYVMTENGPEKLSKDIPSDPDEIERLMAR